MNIKDGTSPGFILRNILRGHINEINRISWSPDGQFLATPSIDGTVQLWHAGTGQLLHTFDRGLARKRNLINCVIWSPDGRTLASGGISRLILWDARTGKQIWENTEYANIINGISWSPDGRIIAMCSINNMISLLDIQTKKIFRIEGQLSISSVIWSPDGQILASGSIDGTISFLSKTGELLTTLKGHSGLIHSLAWSPNGSFLASASQDQTIRLWKQETGRQLLILEGHTQGVTSVSFSYDGRLLASKSLDGTVRLWRCDTWQTARSFEEPSSGTWSASLAFHPKAPVLATLTEKDTAIRIWDLNFPTILGDPLDTSSAYYINAKVVLLGDSGVGKSGLGLVLSGQYFNLTDSTHGRQIWIFENKEIKFDDRHRETHETLLWDLAGQPGYRLVHQLHLNEITVALVIFDARNETNPFAGVFHWDRALRQAQLHGSKSLLPMKKFLVAARIDRGGRFVSRTRIESLTREMGFDGYFETSAKENLGVVELVDAIKRAIDWKTLPRVSSTELFQSIKNFLIVEKEAGHLLSTTEDLYRMFLKSGITPTGSEELHDQFATCIGRVESRGLIRRLSFGNLVLLQPELLDSYATALINAVQGEPDGLGSIAENKVRNGDFFVPEDERLKDREQEKLLLIAMVEDLLRYEIVLREREDIIFPSQSTRENPDMPDPDGKAVIFRFEGPILNIYTTMVVRLSQSGIFRKKELWKDAVTFTTSVGGLYGLFLHNLGEGSAELTLFFDEKASQETRLHFEEYVQVHLQRRALPESIRRQRIFMCSSCGSTLTDSHVVRRRQLGFDWMTCGICENRVSILDEKEQLSLPVQPIIRRMDQDADARRAREVSVSILQGRREIGDFDVFLCHNSEDKSSVKNIAEQLINREILPWLDEWELQPGRPWKPLLEQQIEKIKAAAVFVGKSGIGPWQRQELDAFLNEFVDRDCPVIPVLLEDAEEKPQLPIFLRGMTWVDFRKKEGDSKGPDSIERLIWGITGKIPVKK